MPNDHENNLADVPFKQAHSLGAVNSVNWARVLAQMVYYFYATFDVQKRTGESAVRFSVPTGNFGDILAGYLAQQMGLPIEQLILATNENDILTRFFRTGVYGKATVVPTISPSMDIQVASNFERYLFYKMEQDADRVREAMEQFSQNGRLEVSVDDTRVVDPFYCWPGSTAKTLRVIQRYEEQYDYLLDPHTAVGVGVAEQHPASVPTICLATAHPAKFTQTMEQAIGRSVHHTILDALEGRPLGVHQLPMIAKRFSGMWLNIFDGLSRAKEVGMKVPFSLSMAMKYLKPKRSLVSVVTVISMVGVALGVAVLIIVLSVMTGFDEVWRERILGFNAHVNLLPASGRVEMWEPLCTEAEAVDGVEGAAPPDRWLGIDAT